MNKPTTKLGKWSVGLNMVFLAAIIISVVLVNVFKILDYNDRWWDVTVGVMAPIELIAFITGIIALRVSKDRSRLVWLSIIIGISAIIFTVTHSLFIKD